MQCSKVAPSCSTRLTHISSKPVSRVQVIVRAEGAINPGIRKSEPKVVDILKASDLPKKATLCRCWLSEKFPYCNGAHVKHNQETGDNVGPLIIEKEAPAAQPAA